MPGILIAAIFAATMSTISAGINSLSTASIVDFYSRVWNRRIDDQTQLSLAKRLTLVYGSFTILLAFAVDRFGTMLLETSNTIIGLVGGPLLGMFLLGILSIRANSRGTIAGWCMGVLSAVILAFGREIAIWVPAPLSDWLTAAGNVSFLWYTLISCMATVMFGLLASRVLGPPSAERLRGLVARSGYWPEDGGWDGESAS